MLVKARYLQDGDLIIHNNQQLTVQFKKGGHKPPIELPYDEYLHLEGNINLHENQQVELLNPPVSRLLSLQELLDLRILEATDFFGEYQIVGQPHTLIKRDLDNPHSQKRWANLAGVAI